MKKPRTAKKMEKDSENSTSKSPSTSSSFGDFAFIIGMLEAFVGWLFGMSYGIIALFILLLATLALRPQGLMGKGN